jgi:hypothetical protein
VVCDFAPAFISINGPAFYQVAQMIDTPLAPYR